MSVLASKRQKSLRRCALAETVRVVLFLEVYDDEPRIVHTRDTKMSSKTVQYACILLAAQEVFCTSEQARLGVEQRRNADFM